MTDAVPVRRWLVLGAHIPPAGRLGGMIRYTVEVLRALEARHDVELHVHCRSGAVPFLSGELGIEGRRLHAEGSGSILRDSLVERYGLGRLLARLDPDVVLGTKQLVPRRATRATRVLTVHDMLPLDRPRDFGPAKRALLPAAYRRSIRDADVLACVSNATRRRLTHHEPGAGPRTVVVPNAMTPTLQAAPASTVPDLEGRSFALVVGDRSHRKNLAHLLALWPEVVTRRPDAVLAVVGPPGWGRNQVLPELDGLRRCGAVAELGQVPDGQLRWAYEHASVTLCPSLLEGFGLPVLEALTFGCPVVSSTDPAQMEVAGSRASVVDVGRPGAWVDAIVDHLRRRRRVAPPPLRTWADVATELVAAAHAVETVPVTRPVGDILAS